MKKIFILMGISLALISCDESKDKKDDKDSANKGNEEAIIEEEIDVNDDESEEDSYNIFSSECVDAFYEGMGDEIESFDADKIEELIVEYCDCSFNALIDADISVSDMGSLSQDDIMEHCGACLEDFQNQLIESLVSEE